MDSEAVASMATIYKKESARPLSNYQKRINQAAIDICLKNPGMLKKRQALIDAARRKILVDGFQFVKGCSQSRSASDDSAEKPKAKRPKLSQDVRDKRMKDLEEDLTDITERIGNKEKRIAESINISNFKKCDELKEEVVALRRQKRELEAKKKKLTTSQRKSNWYYKKTAESSTSAECHDSESGSESVSAGEPASSSITHQEECESGSGSVSAGEPASSSITHQEECESGSGSVSAGEPASSSITHQEECESGSGSVSAGEPASSSITHQEECSYPSPRTPNSIDLVDYFKPSSPPVIRDVDLEFQTSSESGYSENDPCSSASLGVRTTNEEDSENSQHF